MSTATHERYVFLRFADLSVYEAILILEQHTDAVPHRLGYAALRYAVICYMRPFTAGKTRHEFPQPKGSPRRQIALPRSIVPSKFAELHDELRNYRHGAFAHTDIDKLNPRLGLSPSNQHGFPIACNPIDRKPLHLHKSAMLGLFQGVRDAIGEQMRLVEDEIRQSLAEPLPE
ncbi:hypothetical protein ACQVBX_05325 [Dyella sp. KULCS107]|uniref:hypothetical protein n=1 Tax=Dyella sp. KULCS107 TaxID=3422216 RepID=UPI003D6E1423